MSHTVVLAIAYATICAFWWGLIRVVPLWRHSYRAIFIQPWREVIFASVAVVGVLLLGQLWSHGIRLRASGPWMPVTESLNQLLIFCPIILLPIIRKQGLESAWIQPRRLWLRLGIGLGLALIGLLIYSELETGASPFSDTVKATFRFKNTHIAVQVLLEDVAIAIVFVRVAAVLQPRWAILSVAALFAAGHLPALFSAGASAQEMLGLIRDFALGALAIGTLWRGSDISWFWPVHFALDMTQFIGHAQ
jgi:hypothetical protein